MSNMLYNKRADHGCNYGCCLDFGKHGGLSNRKHRQQSTGILRTREKRDYMSEVMEALLDSAPLPLPEVEGIDDIVRLFISSLDEVDCCDPKPIAEMNRILAEGNA